MASKGIVGVYNKSNQTISLQACPPGGDFYLHEQQVRVASKKTVYLNKSYLMMEQINNLQSRGLLKVISDTDEDK